MILYLIKSGLCLAIVLSIYHLLLEREKMHHFNRYYLLFGLGFSFAAPLISVDFAFNLVGTEVFNSESSAVVLLTENTTVSSKEAYSFRLDFFIMILYCLVAGIFFVRFFYRLTTLLRKAFGNRKVLHQSAILVLLKEKVLPYTFWNYIFVEEAAYEQQRIESELFTHELTHARQRHSFDILLIEALQILFWFNPILMLYKQAIQLNHEFLADDQVIKSHRRVREYQHLLLDKANFSKVYLASNLNFSVTKKRLIMMTKNTSRKRTFLFAFATIPLFVCLLMLFGTKAKAQETSTEMDQVEQLNLKDSYFKNTTIVRQTKDGRKIYKPYSDLTPAEKRDLPPPPSMDKIASLPLGTVLHFTEDGKVLFVKNSEVPPPPPPPPSAPTSSKAPRADVSKTPPSVGVPKPPVMAPKPPAPPKASGHQPQMAPPPPPPPPAPHIHMEQLAKEGATFMKDGKEITKKEAIELAKKEDSGYMIHVKKGGNDSKPTVYFKRKKL